MKVRRREPNHLDMASAISKEFDRPSNREVQREQYKADGLSKEQERALRKRKAELEDMIRQGMPTHTEMWKATPENIRKHQSWEKRTVSVVAELKVINRRLDPDDPNAGNIEYLRIGGPASKLAKWS